MIKETKVCFGCKKEKKRSEFCTNKQSKDGLFGICRECTNARVKSRNNPPRTEGTKVCATCREEKHVKEYHASKRDKDGLKASCKACRNKENTELRIKKHYLPVMEGTKVCSKCKIEQSVLEFHKCKDSTDGRASWCKNCRREAAIEYNKRPEVKIKTNEYARNFAAKRRKEDMGFRMHNILRAAIYKALKGKGIKLATTLDNLGCSIEFLEEYLKKFFYSHPETGEPMTWDNWGWNSGTWQIHHIKPLFNFDNLRDPVQLKKACNYTNLKPLWFEDHMNLHQTLRKNGKRT